MKRRNSVVVIVAFCVALSLFGSSVRAGGSAGGGPLKVVSGDGLGLSFSETGRISGVSLDGENLAGDGMRSGLWVKPYDQEPFPVEGQVRANGGAVTASTPSWRRC